MTKKYKEYQQLNLPAISEDMLARWDSEEAFQKSVELREGAAPFVFYEGPPSANGLPGIHHVISRTLKDLVCRYKTMKGFQVKRKGGWDTHGLPVELGVEKMLGITKEDIGKKISIAEYNDTCRREVLKYKDKWDELTRRMGYWVDLKNPYITFENKYIETLWWLLAELYKKGLLYESVSIQPYSPAAGTGLSSHELNQPGCYKDVKDTSVVAMFRLDAAATRGNAEKVLPQSANALKTLERIEKTVRAADGKAAAAKGGDAGKTTNDPAAAVDPKRTGGKGDSVKKADQFAAVAGLEVPAGAAATKAGTGDVFFLAWTTTPWTLPSNLGLTVGPRIDYVLVKTFNPYTHLPVHVILAKALIHKYFKPEGENGDFGAYGAETKVLPWQVLAEFKGTELGELRYEQLLPYEANSPEKSGGDPFRVVLGDFVTTEDGTGIVHTAPAFGADDYRVGSKYGIGILTMVDKSGKFVDGLGEFSGRYVKNYKDNPGYVDVNVDISVKLKKENRAFKVEKYEHNYPHCWRTDKPVLYYPLDAWFIRTTAFKDRMVQLNKTINWKPKSTGEGRFGNWLENMVDWNLSRSRYWGTPLPVWRTSLPENPSTEVLAAREEICIGSIAQLKAEIRRSIAAGLMKPDGDETGYIERLTADLHRPYVDEIVLASRDGRPMYRVPDLIDVWFDSGAMPYAQWHFPFENKEVFAQNYPADFIAEGVDQTRGWFYTLHAIAALVKESVQDELRGLGLQEDQLERRYPGLAYRTVVSNGLVLDKNGNKMSKRLGNVINPFDTIGQYGADATRWYLITNASPWESMKFDLDGIREVQRKFFGTLYNTYQFFVLYANVDGFVFREAYLSPAERPEIDRWILSSLNSLVAKVNAGFDDYEPTLAGRLIEDFVDEHLSNWFVRLSRRRFWKGEYEADKISAYQTLYECLETISRLMAPISPFFADWLFRNLNDVTGRIKITAGHKGDETGKREAALGGRESTGKWKATAGGEESAGKGEAAAGGEESTGKGEATEGRGDRGVQQHAAGGSSREPAGKGDAAEDGGDRGVQQHAAGGSGREPAGKGDAAEASDAGAMGTVGAVSVHYVDFPVADTEFIDEALEARMQMAQDASSLILSLRKKVNIKVRQPLQRVLIPVSGAEMREQLEQVEDLIRAEVNVKEIQYLSGADGFIKKKIKPNFIALGKKLGARMKPVSNALANFTQEDIAKIEKDGQYNLLIDNESIILQINEVEITSEDIPGWVVANKNALTVALDVTVTPALAQEGNAREFVNRIQKIRKDNGYDLTDRILVKVADVPSLTDSLMQFNDYICAEILADRIELVMEPANGTEIEVNDIPLKVFVTKKA
ncbi:MAG TPA: isoleucine--tRNA ligase [Puia sp.]|nr:isoleucine--tRNA ligase [Puia sp.]